MKVTLPRPPMFGLRGSHEHFMRIQNEIEQAFSKVEARDTQKTGRAIHNVVSFTDADATPSVANGTYFVTANTGATTITDFDDAVLGQEIIVEIGDANTTIDFTASGLKGNAGVDWSPTTGDHMRCVFNGTDWLCEVSDNTA